MIYEHNLNPIAFNIYNLKIYWYSLSYIFGFLFCFYYSKYLIRKRFIDLDILMVDDFITWLIIGVILGGRIGYVLFYNFSFFSENPIEIFKIWRGGMSFHGGLLGVLFTTLLFSLKKEINLIKLLNLVCHCSPVGIFLGRLANFVNGELIGIPTNSTWGVKYTNEEILRHPSQLYEAFFEGFVIFVILNFLIRSRFASKFHSFSVFLFFYGFFRFFLEFFRMPDNHLGYLLFGLSMGQLLSIPMVCFGIYYLSYEKK
jgi:phosphatidylglycerol:prolipoprotein diacylglycerol transferase